MTTADKAAIHPSTETRPANPPLPNHGNSTFPEKRRGKLSNLIDIFIFEQLIIIFLHSAYGSYERKTLLPYMPKKIVI